MKKLEGYSYYDVRAENPAEYAKWVAATAGLIDKWIGGDATKKAVWTSSANWTSTLTRHPLIPSWTHSWPTQPVVPSWKK